MDKIKDFRDIISFGLLFVVGFIWMETQYVDAGELRQYIVNEKETQIFYLEQKKKRLENEDKKLDLEDELMLDRLKREQRQEK